MRDFFCINLSSISKHDVSDVLIWVREYLAAHSLPFAAHPNAKFDPDFVFVTAYRPDLMITHPQLTDEKILESVFDKLEKEFRSRFAAKKKLVRYAG